MSEQLEELVLNWAREKMPEAYEKTVNVKSRPATYKVYLLRLVELRYEAEPDWRTECPLRILEHTKIRQTMHLFGYTIVVEGSKCEGERKWGWAELADFMDDHRGVDITDACQSFKQLVRIKGDWDCVVEDGKGPKAAALSVATEPAAKPEPEPVSPRAPAVVQETLL